MERLVNYEFDLNSPDELIKILEPIRSESRLDLEFAQLKYGSNIKFWQSLGFACNDLVDLLIEENRIEVLKSIGIISDIVGILCIECSSNQKISLTIFEASFRRFLVHASSFINLQDPIYLPITRSYCRTLCNMVTNNEQIASIYFEACLADEQSDKMISRLLAATDMGILNAVAMFILNLIHSNRDRCLLFATSLSGSMIFDQLLLLASLTIEDDLNGIPSTVSNVDDMFTLGYGITEELINQGLFPEAYSAQASTKDFLVSDSQLTLLKFLDGYLQEETNSTISFKNTSFLIKILTNLSKDFFKSNREKDARDVTTLQAVILLLASLSSIGLGSDEGRLSIISIIQDVVLFLKIGDTIIPSTEVEPLAIGQLKRSCVRILGIVSWESKEAQDAIREAGGLTLLLGMCQINDTNITLREHALFAIRNVLKNNLENQALIEGLTPMYLVGKGGELRDLPPAMR